MVPDFIFYYLLFVNEEICNLSQSMDKNLLFQFLWMMFLSELYFIKYKKRERYIGAQKEDVLH